MSKLEIYTLTDEAFVPGVVALVNSLRRTGFDGQIHVGSPEPLSIASCGAPAVQFHILRSDRFYPTNRKAELLLAHPAERFAYFDADTLVVNPSFIPRFTEWIELAFVCSFEAVVPNNDHRRFGWARRLGFPADPLHWPNHYFNAGLFGGIFKRDCQLLETWDQAIKKLIAPPGAAFIDVDFPLHDQDVLNGILQQSADVLGVGQPDIWYAASPVNPFLCLGSFNGPALLHCTGLSKPWKLATGADRAPNIYEQHWFNVAVQNPNPLKLSMSLPKGAAAWLAYGRAARFTSKSRRVGKRLFTTLSRALNS
jgi:hypothetical protein